MDVIPSDAVEVSDPSKRAVLLEALTAIPGFLEPIRKLASERGFIVLMSEENAHLFKANDEGVYKPFLHNGRRFVENVDLKKMPFDYIALLANVAGQAQMAIVMRKLDGIATAIKRTNDEARNAVRAKVEGRVLSMQVARELRLPDERRARMLSACDDLITDLTTLVRQLRSNIEAMPSEKSGLLDGWFGDKLAEADTAFQDVAADISAIKLGIRAVLSAYAELGESEAARVAFAGIIGELKRCDLGKMRRRAGLVRTTEGGDHARGQAIRFEAAISSLEWGMLASPGVKSLIKMEVTQNEIARLA